MKIRNRGFGLVVTVAVTLALGAVAMAQAKAQEIQFYRIGTGGTAGTYYPIGGLIANAISNPPGSLACDKGGSCGVPGLVAMVQSSGGSIENVDGVGAGKLELALSQADIAYWAYHGTGLYRDKGAVTNLRAIANLYPESLHVVVRRDDGIGSIADLRGKRVALGEKGSGTLVEAKAVLDAYGLGEADFEPRFLPPGEAGLALADGQIDGFFLVAGYPVTAIAEIARIVDIDVLAIGEAEAESVVAFYPFFTRSIIPAGVYSGVGEVATISIGAQLLVAATIDEDVVFQITAALWHDNARHLLDEGHAKGKDIRLETALDGIAVPLHPGAERFYREIGLVK